MLRCPMGQYLVDMSKSFHMNIVQRHNRQNVKNTIFITDYNRSHTGSLSIKTPIMCQMWLKFHNFEKKYCKL